MLKDGLYLYLMNKNILLVIGLKFKKKFPKNLFSFKNDFYSSIISK